MYQDTSHVHMCLHFNISIPSDSSRTLHLHLENFLGPSLKPPCCASANDWQRENRGRQKGAPGAPELPGASEESFMDFNLKNC